jgi:transcriptional regulator with XRE-family HTH domain
MRDDLPMTETSPHLYTRLAVNVRRLRKERNWTFKVTADMTGIHIRQLQKIEAGEANASLMSLARLACGFRVDACKLLEPESEK